MSPEDGMWQALQQRLGYSDQELEQFKANPRNLDVLAKAPALAQKTLVAEVIESHGCVSGHKKGVKFYFDAAGNLLGKQNPPKICIYALHALTMGVFAMGELLMAGMDPNQMRFKHAGCFDVGLQCGGWGHIVLELRAEDRSE